MIELKSLKQAFIKEIEGLNSQYMLQKKIYSILMALSLENKPLTQDDLIELTNYKRSEVSQTLKQINALGYAFPRKFQNDRKKYYETSHHFDDIFIAPIERTLEVMSSSDKFILDFIKKMQTFKVNHPEVEHFIACLNILQEIMILQFEIVEEVTLAINRQKGQEIKPRNKESLLSKVNVNFQKLEKNNTEPIKLEILAEKLDPKIRNKFDEIKKEFTYTLINYIFGIGTYEAIGAIVDILFFEYYPVNQDRLIYLTGFARSTISTIITRLENLGFIKMFKIKGDRKKYYRPTFSLHTLPTMKFKRSYAYLEILKNILTNYRKKINKTTRKNEAVINFMKFIDSGLNFLTSVENIYIQIGKKFKIKSKSLKPFNLPY